MLGVRAQYRAGAAPGIDDRAARRAGHDGIVWFDGRSAAAARTRTRRASVEFADACAALGAASRRANLDRSRPSASRAAP